VNAAAFLAKQARQRPDQVAIRHGEESLTYREFYEDALAFGGNMLDRGLRFGDRVAFVLANSPRVLETIYGCFAAGLVVVPINARLHPREIAYIVQNSGARALVHGPEYHQGIDARAEEFDGLHLRICTDRVPGAFEWGEVVTPGASLTEPVDVDPADPSWLFYTSGTTGRPKGATWTHRTISIVAMNYLADVHNIQGGEVVLHAAPMSHGSGIVALPAVARGAEQVIFEPASFSPDALFAQIERDRVSHVAFLAPTQIVKMLEEFEPGKYDLSSLRAICYGGAPIHVEHLRAALKAFGPVFAQIFGQGEAPITITGLPAAEHAELLAADDPRIGSAGRIRTDVEVRVVDENDEEQPPGVPGDIVMKGYWDNPDATAETLRGGWLHTGDIGSFDEAGYLFLLDRAKDMIISGGNNVYPREVEEVLVEHPAVAQVVVVGIPDDYWGEAVHAVVVLVEGARPTDKELVSFCGENLAGYKKPKGVDFVDELPVSGYGKVLRREVRDRYWTEQGGRAISGGVSAGRAQRAVSPGGEADQPWTK
jgi:acyl-CoA synthetase (AMP-forming)/AMP-acid ligase II